MQTTMFEVFGSDIIQMLKCLALGSLNLISYETKPTKIKNYSELTLSTL